MLNLKIAAFADEASRNFDEQITAMIRNDISLLEVRFVDDENISAVSIKKAKTMRQKLDEHNMEVWSIGSPTGKISLKDEFGPHLDQFRHQLDLAEILGANHYRLFSFYDCDESQACFDLVCERLKCFIDTSKGSGIVLCHENEKKIYGDTPSRCLKLHKALSEIRAVFDPANFMQCGADVLSAWELLKPYVEYLHIKDCDQDGRIVPPGMGLGQLPILLKKYAELDGSVVTLEPHLSKFIGLDQLENGEKTEIALSFSDGNEAFDAAATALRDMLVEG